MGESLPVAQEPAILVVDDLLSARRIVVKLLKKFGFANVSEASGGSQALSLIEEHPPSLVICDWQMPDMEGIELLARLRSSPQHAQLPFIMITSNVGREQVLAALKAGASDYILKPFNAETLSSKVLAVLNQKA